MHALHVAEFAVYQGETKSLEQQVKERCGKEEISFIMALQYL